MRRGELTPILDLFARRLPAERPAEECWEASGYRNPVNGYVYVAAGPGGQQKRVGAHRLAYEYFVGHIPPGLHVLHRCDNPPCVNPAHLWVGTVADNMHDRDRKGRQRNQVTGPLAARV